MTVFLAVTGGVLMSVGIVILPREMKFMIITKQTVADQIAAHCSHCMTLAQLVD